MKGFAFTLGLTTILDVVVVFLVTWPLIYLASKSPTMAKPALNGLGAVQQIAEGGSWVANVEPKVVCVPDIFNGLIQTFVRIACFKA